MSWDIVLFNSKQKIASLDEVDDTKLIDINFGEILDAHFPNATGNDTHRAVDGENFSFVYYPDDEPVSNTIINLYGEEALLQIIPIAIQHNWQIFDTGSGKMLDLTIPSQNGFENFRAYLKQILDRED